MHAALHLSGERVAPVLLSGEGKRTRVPEQQGQAGAQGQGLWVCPGLRQGAGVRCGAVGTEAEAVPPAGNPEEPEHPGCCKLLASWPGDGAPWPVIPQLEEPPREAAGVGPTGSWGKPVKFSSPNPPSTWPGSRGVQGKLRGTSFRCAGCVWVGAGGRWGLGPDTVQLLEEEGGGSSLAAGTLGESPLWWNLLCLLSLGFAVRCVKV